MQKVQMFHVARVRVRGLKGLQQEERLRVCGSDSVSLGEDLFSTPEFCWTKFRMLLTMGVQIVLTIIVPRWATSGRTVLPTLPAA